MPEITGRLTYDQRQQMAQIVVTYMMLSLIIIRIEDLE